MAFVAQRLAWERRVNRFDLVDRFGISPNQATADLRRFAELHPGAMVYDLRGKAYRPTEAWDRPNPADTETLLRELRLVAEGVMGPADGTLAACPAVAVADLPPRQVPPAVLAHMVAAIRDRIALTATYQSFSTPEPRVRRLEPHALVFDGFRWHARARDVDEDRFKDFVLGRLIDTRFAGRAVTDGTQDEDWHLFVTLRIGPHPGLAAFQRAAVESDYGMTAGCLTLAVRKAVLFYTRRRLGLTDGHEQRRPEEQRIILLP